MLPDISQSRTTTTMMIVWQAFLVSFKNKTPLKIYNSLISQNVWNIDSLPLGNGADNISHK